MLSDACFLMLFHGPGSATPSPNAMCQAPPPPHPVLPIACCQRVQAWVDERLRSRKRAPSATEQLIWYQQMRDTQRCIDRLAEVLRMKTDLRGDWFVARTTEILDSFNQHVELVEAARGQCNAGNESYNPGALSEVRRAIFACLQTHMSTCTHPHARAKSFSALPSCYSGY